MELPAAPPGSAPGSDPDISRAETLPPAMALSLDQAIGTALVQNPDLVSLRQGDPVGQAIVGVARTYPWNPFVQTECFPTPRDKSGETGTTEYYVWLMQTLEVAHQRRYREEGAMSALNSTRWNIHQAELLNVAQTERLFFTALYQRDLRDLTRQIADLNDELFGIVQRRFEAGQAKAVDVTTAHVASRSSRRQADLAEATFQTAMLALRQQIKLPPSTHLELKGDLAQAEWFQVSSAVANDERSDPNLPASLEVTASSLVAGRPDVMAARADVATARAAAGLARANRIPNLQIGPIYKQDDFGTQFAGFRTHTNIPVWDSGKPLANQREAEYRQRAIALQQLQERASIEALVAIDRYERARSIVERSRADFGHELPVEIQQTQDQFLAGQTDIVTVFTIRASLIQDRRSYADTLNELAQAAANVTATTGIPPRKLIRITQ
jgi:outer membrane protein TolC